MSQLTVRPGSPLRGRVRVPGDKSISHRALLLGALAGGPSHVRGFLPCSDCLATQACLQALGVRIETHDVTSLTVHGGGLHGLAAPSAPLDCVRSGTTMRLLVGILAGQSFESCLTGEPQLLRRPMRRVVEPLRQMGAGVEDTDGHAPLAIRPQQLRGGEHRLAIASAQVKSALLLAGLYAEGPTIIHEPGPARDHTERLLAQMGASIEIDGREVTLSPPAPLTPLSLTVPGDVSAAAFPLVAALLLPGSEVVLEGVGVNPTRIGLLDVLQAMGAGVTLVDERAQGTEPVADLAVRHSSLTGVEVGGDTVVRMIDEFPILAVAATQAHGRTVVRDAAELRVKETDRVATVAGELRRMGAQIDPQPDGFIIEGPTRLRGATVSSHGDHRLAMALAVAGRIARGETIIEQAACIRDSFPGFVALMKALEGERG